MNPYASETRCCQRCKHDLPHSYFGRLESARDKINPMCKECIRQAWHKMQARSKEISGHERRARESKTDKARQQQESFDAKMRVLHDFSYAAPRTINKLSGFYVPPVWQCRNDGNVHIGSRGL